MGIHRNSVCLNYKISTKLKKDNISISLIKTYLFILSINLKLKHLKLPKKIKQKIYFIEDLGHHDICI